MVKHIGIVGCSAEGAALCYRTICKESEKHMGQHDHPEVSMHTYSLADYIKHIDRDDWPGVASLMLSSSQKLFRCSAQFAICPDNTIHQAYPLFINKSPIPWLHIAEIVAEEAEKNQFKKLGLLGTKYLMVGPVYPEQLKNRNINYALPGEGEREEINRIIFSELVKGIIKESSRHYFNQVIDNLRKKGCDAAVLGCTEIPLIVRNDDCPLPTLDSTRLLARAAINYALS